MSLLERLNKTLQKKRCMVVWNSTSGLADKGGCSSLQEGGPEVVLQLSHYSASLESLFHVTGKEATTESRILDSGEPMQIPSWSQKNRLTL